MSSNNLQGFSGVISPLALLRRGVSGLAQWQETRTRQRYEEFIRSALDGDVFPENAESMSADDLFAILMALDRDMESEKAQVYGRMACSIASGHVRDDLKRHFIKTLQDMSYAQLQQLQGARIAQRHRLFPGVGVGCRRQSEFLEDNAINKALYERFGLVESSALTAAGENFVDACFRPEELRPASIGAQEWASSHIQVICNELGTRRCSDFVQALSMEANHRAIRTINHAALPSGRTTHLLLKSAFVVLLTDDVAELLRYWEVVHDSMLPNAIVMLVSTSTLGSPLPPRLEGYTHIDASGERASDAVSKILQTFEGSGFVRSPNASES